MKEDAKYPSFFNFFLETWQKRPFWYQQLNRNAAGCISARIITAEFTFSKLKGPKRATAAKVIVGILLGILAIFGTLWGMKLPDGTVINVRELTSMIAGAAGGPIAGTIADLIGGLHRNSYGGTTAIPCAVSSTRLGTKRHASVKLW